MDNELRANIINCLAAFATVGGKDSVGRDLNPAIESSLAALRKDEDEEFDEKA